MEDAFGKRETLTVTHNHPYLRAANDNAPWVATQAGPRPHTAGGTPSGPPVALDQAIGARGAGILNAVKLDPGGDWSAAGLLQPGDRVRSGKGAHLEVVAVEPVAGLAVKVYNLEVADHHTYAVGEFEAWAHNAKGLGRIGDAIAGLLTFIGICTGNPEIRGPRRPPPPPIVRQLPDKKTPPGSNK